MENVVFKDLLSKWRDKFPDWETRWIDTICSSRKRRSTRLSEGRQAWSEYRVLRRFAHFTLLEVQIGTGRTHQIRVHLSSIGHPVAGDRLYGAPAGIPGRPPLGRYFLHAASIRFAQPSSGQPVEVSAPLPRDLELWMQGL